MTSSANVPVVLVHGWGGSFSDTWHTPGIDALLEDMGRHVIGVDLLGHGESEKPHDPEAYADLAGWLLETIAVDYPVVDIVGFSLGALTTLGALVQEPSRFRKVVLAGIGNDVLGPPNPDQGKAIIAALEGTAPETDTVALLFRQYASRPGNDIAALTAVMKRPTRRRITDADLAKLPHETLVCIGDKDFAGPADKLAAAFPNGRLTVLKNTDHFATTENFAFIDAILDFLADTQ